LKNETAKKTTPEPINGIAIKGTTYDVALALNVIVTVVSKKHKYAFF
jgi:hypothetical protein